MSSSYSRVVNGLVGAAQSVLGVNAATTPALHPLSTAPNAPSALYELMRALVDTNPYKQITDHLASYGLADVAMQSLRNPTYAVCDVYRSTLWPGTIREDDDQSALPLVLPNTARYPDNLRARIHDVWRYTRLNLNLSQIAFDLPLLGDQIFKVLGQVDDAGKPKAPSPQFQLVQPEYLTDLDVDSRGYLSFVRIDVPYIERLPDGTRRRLVRTELWDKQTGRYRRWVREISAFTPTGELGAPEEDIEIDQVYGTDFVPFVQMKFRASSAGLRGVPAVLHALDKIIYGDALVTALHQRLTNHNIPDKVLESVYVDPNIGISIPPPQLGDVGNVAVDGERLWSIPSGWHLSDTVAQLDYANHLAVVQAHYDSLAMTDLPELAWYRVMQDQRLSGVAFDFKLIPARARIDEARGNAEAALMQATQMALTIGQRLGMPGYEEATIGTYERGDFEFWIADRPIAPMSPQEQATLDLTKAQTLQAETSRGLTTEGAMRLAGYGEEDIAAVAQITMPVQP